jgi:DNA-binding HxlR family transcriptional regulator
MIERIEHVLAVIREKWKVQLLFLMARGIHRHGRLLVCLPGGSKKVMTDALRSLEHDGLVTRELFAEVPARVEYSLTPLGWAITEPLVALAEWGEARAGGPGIARSCEQPGAGTGTRGRLARGRLTGSTPLASLAEFTGGLFLLLDR